MKTGTKRFLIELVATAAASPLLLFLLLLVHAFNVLALIAYPTLPLLRVFAELELPAANARGGFIPGFAAGLDAALVIVPVWTWFLLMILVKLSETSIKLLRRFNSKRVQA